MKCSYSNAFGHLEEHGHILTPSASWPHLDGLHLALCSVLHFLRIRPKPQEMVGEMEAAAVPGAGSPTNVLGEVNPAALLVHK